MYCPPFLGNRGTTIDVGVIGSIFGGINSSPSRFFLMEGNFENDKRQYLEFLFMRIFLGVFISICLFSSILIAAESERSDYYNRIDDFYGGFGPEAICTASILRIREKPLILKT